MQEWMLAFVDNFGYLAIFLMIFIESIFPPIPSEVILLFGGALTITTAMNIPGTIIAATIGSLLGAIILYAIGRALQAERIKRLLKGKLGKITHLRPEHVQKAEQWFACYQDKAVLICRCIPLVRSLISIPAGFAKMPLPRFLLLTALGSAVWNAVLVCVGSKLGAAWKSALPYLQRYTDVVLIILIILLLAGIIYYLYRRHKNTDRNKNNKGKWIKTKR